MAKGDFQVVRNDALWPRDDVTREQFVARVWEEGGVSYRDLPWRNIDDPYAVLVSEVMLQQTQVSRVQNYWQRFLDAFPTVPDLAQAETADVLKLWQGLGYNRRAVALKRAAEALVAEGCDTLPATFDELVKLPGIGPATAAGIVAFAYEKPAVYVETNVRAVFIHELFPDEDKVPDADLLPFVSDTADTSDPRGWYYALLDYGAALKRSGINPTRASTTYARQSAFEGSRRQKRAELVRIVLGARDGAQPRGAGEAVSGIVAGAEAAGETGSPGGTTGISLADARQALDAFEDAHGRGPVDDELFASLVDDLERDGMLRRDADRILPA